MRPLTAKELLQVWEQGIAQPPVWKALGLLAAATPEMSLEQLSVLPIGQRNGRLLTLREWTFGSHIESVANCPHCGEVLELNFTINDIRVDPALVAETDLQLERAGYRVHYRLPNSQDLELVGAYTDPLKVQAIILSRCLLEVFAPSEAAETTLPDEVKDAVVAAMVKHDPQADIELALTCSACEHPWTVGFDIVTFFWHEINTWARRLLWDIHRLARVYGWSESEILALSPLRRQFYLEMVDP